MRLSLEHPTVLIYNPVVEALTTYDRRRQAGSAMLVTLSVRFHDWLDVGALVQALRASQLCGRGCTRRLVVGTACQQFVTVHADLRDARKWHRSAVPRLEL